MNRRWATAVAAVVTLGVAGCGSDSGEETVATAKDDDIVIGAAIAQTGNMAAYDVPAWNAFKLKVDEINAAGGIDGVKIRVVEADTKSDPAQGKAAAERVLAEGADIVLATCDFDFGSPAAITAEQAGKLNFSLCAQSPKWGVQGIGPLSYTTAIATFSEGSVLATFAEQEGWDRAVVMVDDLITYDREVCDGFKQSFDGEVVGESHFKSGDASIASQVTEVLQADPGFVVFCSFPPGGPAALRQLRAAGVDVPIISGNAMDGTYWTESVPNLNDFFVSATVSIFGNDPNDKVNEVVQAYTDTYGAAPAVGLAFSGYADMEAIAMAIEATGGSTDGAALAEALDQFDKVDLLVGKTSFTSDLHINTDRSMSILEFVDGTPEWVASVPSDPAVELSMSE